MRRILLVLPPLLLALLVTRASALGTLDQSNTATPNQIGIVAAGAPNISAQIFTAGLTGALDTATLDLITDTPGTSVPLALYATDGAGTPTTQLATTSASVTTPLTLPPGPPLSQYTAFTFSAPATVTAGTQYALLLLPPQAGIVYWWGENGSPYNRGFYIVSPAGLGGPWFGMPGTSADFQTFVTPPPAPSVTVTGQPLLGLTIATKGCGTTTPAGTVATYQSQNVVVRAIPCLGSTFTGWTGGPCNGTTINPCDIGVGMSMMVTATFTP